MTKVLTTEIHHAQELLPVLRKRIQKVCKDVKATRQSCPQGDSYQQLPDRESCTLLLCH